MWRFNNLHGGVYCLHVRGLKPSLLQLLRLFLFLSTFGFVAFASDKPRDANPAEAAFEEIRIASYNLKNYLIMDRLVDGNWRRQYPKPEVEKESIQAILLKVQPDILVIQEIGGQAFLNELSDDLSRQGLDYPYAILMQGSDPIRQTALLSRIKPRYTKKHDDLNYRYFDGMETVKRGLLEVGFVHGIPFTLFSLHLKSRFSRDKRDPFSAQWRLKEAEACRNRIIERVDDKKINHYCIIGDFNDNPNSTVMRRFYKRGDRIIGHQLLAEDSRGETWTYLYAKERVYSTVDGFVLSPELLSYVENDSAAIWDQPKSEIGSDHRLVYFDLRVPK